MQININGKLMDFELEKVTPHRAAALLLANTHNRPLNRKRVRTLAEVTALAAAPAGTINPLASLIKVHSDRQTVSDIGTVALTIWLRPLLSIPAICARRLFRSPMIAPMFSSGQVTSIFI